ncbi:MAG: glycosyltransferase 87 family protein, partial [Acidimicrobiia bacterium]
MSVAQSRKLLLVGAVLGILAGITLFVAHSHTYLDVSASDFAINRAAAQQLLDRDPVYDADAERDRLKQEGLYRGQLAAESFTGTYSNFIGLPTTALVYTPFANMNFDDALLTFQIVEVACFLGAVVIVGFAVPRRNRVLAWLVGLAALLLFFPVMSSLALGVAVLLKISPWVVLAFVLLRVGRRCLRVVIGAASAVAVLLALSTLVGGRPHDIVTWLSDVVPTLSRGNRSVENQSVPALLARFLVGGDDLVATTIPIGGYRFVGYLIAVAGILGMWWWRRNRSFVPLELGALILIALLSGPIS